MSHSLNGPARNVVLLILVAIASVGCSSPEAADFATDPDIIYEDDFSSTQVGQWLTESDELGTTAVEGGSLVIDIDSANTLQYASLEEPQFSDFDMEVNATLLDGSEQSTYGVLVRMKSPTEFYRFELMGDGRYMVERRNGDGTWKRFMDDWQQSDVIQPGINAFNTIRVVAQGPELAFYVNGELLHELQDAAYDAGNIGLDAGTYGQPKVRVAFDNLVVSNP